MAFHVTPSRGPDFQPWAWGMLNASAQQPGFLGGGVLVDGEAEWHVVYRFASEGTVGPGRTQPHGPGGTYRSRTSPGDRPGAGACRVPRCGSTHRPPHPRPHSTGEMETVVREYECSVSAGAPVQSDHSSLSGRPQSARPHVSFMPVCDGSRHLGSHAAAPTFPQEMAVPATPGIPRTT